MSPTSTTRKERRAAERRSLILDSAARLFADKGFHRTTTKDIAEAADVSEGTLYNYFESKDDLLMAIMERLVESQDLGLRLDTSLLSDPQDFFGWMMDERKRFVDNHREMLQSVLSEILVNPQLRLKYYQQMIQPSMRMLEAHLQARLKQGQLRGLAPDLVVRLVVAVTTGLYFLDVLQDPLVRDRWDDLAAMIKEVIFEGISPGRDAPAGQNRSVIVE
jgi:AcrR family transcriptional regulator